MSLRKKQSVKRLKAALNKNYESKANTIQAGPLGSNQIYAAGQVYNASLDGVTEVVNIGRPAAAQYVARRGGGTTVVAAGGGSSSGGGVSGDYLRLDGSAIMLGDLNMGSSDIINVGTVDGVDLSAFKATYDAHILDADAHHDQVHSITGSDHTITSAKWGLVGATAVNTIGILTPSAAPGAAEAILKSTSSGGLTLPLLTATTSVTTPVVASSGDITLDPAANSNKVHIDGLLTGGFGAKSTGGTLDWNDSSNARSGQGYSLLLGTESNGPSRAGGAYFHPLGFEYDGKSGAGSITQLAIPYANSAINAGIWMRGRYLSSWTNWVRVISENTNGSVGINTISPSSAYKLDVSGDARSTGTVYADTQVLTPKITTATNADLLIDPAGNGLVQFPIAQTLGAVGFDSSFPITGWQINEVAGITGKSALTIGNIQADELAVRIFVADETRVDRGDEYWTKSYGIVAEDFVLPTTLESTVDITFEDSPALTGAIFSNNDWLLIRRLEIDAGLTLFNAWGQVTGYTDNGDGTQTWTFTLKQGPTGASEDTRTIAKGSLAIDFGASGAALIHLSVIDDAGAPYIKMRRWSGANPYSPSNYTTYVQIGNLNNITNTYVTPNGDGLYIRSTAGEDKFIIADDNGLQLRGTDLTLYDGGTQTVNINAAGDDVWIGLGSADKRLSWNGTTLSIEGDVIITGGSGIASLSDAGSLATADDLDDVADGSTYKRTNANEKTGAGRAYTAINSSNNLVTSVIPASAITPSGAGLYLGSNYMGYYDSSVWKTYIANTGDFVFAGNAPGNCIQWDASANKLQGVGGSTEQWYADATDGKLYAGAGATWLDVDGVNILADNTTTHASQSNANAVTFERSNGTLVGRLTSYYISGTTTYGLDLYARSPNQEATFATFGSEQAGTTYAGGSAGAPRVVAYNASGGGDELRLYSSGTIKLFNSGSASADVTLSGGTLTTGALNSGALGVTGNITVSGNVDGVDIAAFKSAYDSHTHAYLPLSGGTLTGTLNGRDYIPTTDNTYDLGSASNRIAEAHIASLYVDTIVGTPSYSHTHSASDITSGTLDDARLPGTQSGKTFTSSVHIDADAAATTYNYIRWKTDNTANKRWDLIAYDKDHATTALRNDMLLTYYDGSTTYDVLSIDSGTRVLSFNNTPTVGASTIWHAGNDGASSGLDADLLDGNHASAFALSSHTHAASAITSGTFDLARIPATLTGKTAQYVTSTVVAGSGIDVSGSLSSGNVTVSHSDTSSQVSVNNSGSTFIQDVTLDTYGHVTALASVDAATALSGTFVPVSRTITAGSGLTGGGDLSANRTISHDDTSSQASVNNSGTTIIQDVTLDGFGHVTALGSVDISTALDALYVNVTGDTMTGALTVPAIKNAVLSQPSQNAPDYGMIGYFDRNELVYANCTGSVGVTVTGAYSSVTFPEYLVDGSGGFARIDGTDNTTTQIQIVVDRGSNVSNYSYAQWQPFVAYRQIGTAMTYYNNIVCEVSNNGSTWYKPSGGQWETSDAAGDAVDGSVWIGIAGLPTGLPGFVWRYARFTLTNRVENAAYGSKASVWINHVGFRHVSTNFSRLWLDRKGDTMFGDFVIQTGGGNVFDVDVSAALTTVSGDLDVTDDVTIDGTLAVSPDSDVITELGTVKIGYAAATDTATFSHYDHNSSTAFALSQYSSGATMLNAASGQYVDIGVNATSTLAINADRVLPRGNMQVGLGDYNRKFSDLHAFELIVENLVAQDVMATIGGRIVVAPTTYLSADVALAGANTFFAEHNNLSSGDFAYMATFIDGSAQVEYVRLHSNAVGAGPYEYRVERQAQASNTTTLLNAMTNVATTMDTVANNLSNGDYVQLADYGSFKLETVRVTSSASVITGGYRYSVTRNATSMAAGAQAWSSGQGVKIIAKLWYEGNAIVSTGDAVGEGYIELTSTETLLSQYGPTISITSRTDADVWNGLTEVVALGNLRSRVDYGGNEDYGLAIGNDTSLTPTTGFSGITADATDGIRLFNVDLSLYNSSTQTVDISTTGNIKAGTNVSSSATTTLDFASSTGALRVGAVGTNKPNLYFDGSSLHMRMNTTNVISFTSGGNSLFTGVMTIDTGGEIRQGAGTLGSNYTGLRIWNDTGIGRIGGYASDTLQWYANVDGKFYAGGGALRIDSGGLTVGSNKFTVDTSGNIKAGTNVSSATTTAFDFTASTGATRFGVLAASKANLQFDGTNLNLRVNTTNVASIGGGGTMLIGTTGSNKPNLYYDGSNLNLRMNTTNVISLSSTGASSFENPINLGTSGGIYQGSSGSFASPGTGLKIWRDSNVGRIAGYNGGTAQWYANTDGKLYAGGGGMMIDSTGLHVSNDNTSDGIQLHTSDTMTDGDRAGWLWTLNGSVNPLVYLYAGRNTSWGDASGLWGRLTLEASAGSSSTIGITIDGSTSTIDVSGDLDLNGNDLTDIGTIGEDWIAPTFNTGWSNYGSNFTLAGYKKVGDLVFVQGMVKRTLGSATTIFTLPSGYRPQDNVIRPASTSGGTYAELRVLDTGEVVMQTGSATWFAFNAWFSTLA